MIDGYLFKPFGILSNMSPIYMCYQICVTSVEFQIKINSGKCLNIYYFYYIIKTAVVAKYIVLLTAVNYGYQHWLCCGQAKHLLLACDIHVIPPSMGIVV